MITSLLALFLSTGADIETRTVLAPPSRHEAQRPEIRAAAPLKAGAILTSADLSLPAHATADHIEKARALEGLALKRSVGAGGVLTRADVAPPILVARNAVVVMEFARGSLSILAEGRALSEGRIGDLIRVQNTESKLAVSARVVGANRVEVSR